LKHALGRALAGLLAALACACGAEEPARPSLVLVLVDQLRKDAADQHATRTNELARGGVVLTNVQSPAPWTYPAVVSLLSGLEPQQHGADAHAFELVLKTFSPEVPLLPALLRPHGYRTAAFITNPFLHTWNPFHAGFDHFDVHFIGSEGNRVGFGQAVWTRDMFADRVNEAVRAHFDATPRAGPEFVYVHYIDVHGPWDGAPFAPDYAAAVRWTDAKVAELYEYFLARYAGDVIFLVTSDHGCALGDEEKLGASPPVRRSKRSLHAFNLHVPFWILPSARVREPRVIDAPASLVDVVPTLFDWLALPLPYASPGVSWLPWLRGEPAAERDVYARVAGFGWRSDALVHAGRKYVRVFDPRSGALRERAVFDLARDPQELAPRAGGFGPVEARLERAAGDHGLAFPARVEALDAETRARLEALGYLR
jgi:arylsulfatase A-like enzyme